MEPTALSYGEDGVFHHPPRTTVWQNELEWTVTHPVTGCAVAFLGMDPAEADSRVYQQAHARTFRAAFSHQTQTRN